MLFERTSPPRPDPANSDNVGKNCIYPSKIATTAGTSTVVMTRLSGVNFLRSCAAQVGRA